MNEVLLLAIGLLAGALFMYFLQKSHSAKVSRDLQDQILILSNNKTALEQSLIFREEDIVRLRKESDSMRESQLKQTSAVSRLEAENRNLLEKLEHQQQDMIKAGERLNLEFKNIANELLEEKSQKFTKANRENLDEILKPLRQKILEFEQKVEHTHKESLERNAGLVQQILGLKELNQQMSKEASNLTRALKGETKKQGNWGEFILESVLEKSGLQKDREYFTQVSMNQEDGRRMQPDVIIRLPENRCLIIDSKVTLTAYEKFSSAEDEETRNSGIREHVLSFRNHIRGLSDKKYQDLQGLNSPDFVLMFIPIEPAFALALQADSGLFSEAFDKNIVLVSPTTLLATLRTIEGIWRQEHQNQHAAEIARQGGDLYDKFVSFTDDLLDVGNHIQKSQKSWQNAINKLSEGKGNLIRRAESLQKLGIKTGKQINPQLHKGDTDEA
jgi:DNA recombination protein RmuC